MSTLIKEITEQSNLYWAWEKVKWCYTPGDIWFNEIEVATFEANLNNELESIRNEILNGLYKLSPIQPIPYPKTKSDEGKPRTRQTFWIAVRDQVAWLAVINIIGKYTDSKMPFWSYGNRLFIPVFKEENATAWSFGYYRNTTKFIYRTWKQSWPLFRRHINLTSKLLARNSNNLSDLEIDDTEQLLVHTNQVLPKRHPLRVKYIESEYWDNNTNGELYWAGIDFEKFYPNVKQKAIKKNIKKALSSKMDSSFENLINVLFDFFIDYSGWTDSDLHEIGLDRRHFSYTNIPTGLFGAGFLANMALLEIDSIINKKLEKNKKIAHFRYVDDHVILSTSLDDLMEWIIEYQKLLEIEDVGAIFNLSKTEPQSLAEYYELLKSTGGFTTDENQSELIEKKAAAKSDMLLDPAFPTPLMTQTLAKVSKLARTNFHLLTPQEENSLIADVEHLLVTEFPDQELRKDTRVSFAARMLCTIIPELTTDIEGMYNAKKQLMDIDKEIEELKKKKKTVAEYNKEALNVALTQLKSDKKVGEKKLQLITIQLAAEDEKIGQRTLKLLLKAVKENHEKVRLWTRVLEFCLKMGIPYSIKVFELIKELKDKNETNALSVKFIYALTIQIISNLLLQSFAIVANSTFSNKRKKRAKIFITSILDHQLLGYVDALANTNTLSFEKNTQDLFRFCAGTIIHLLKNHCPKDFKDCSHLIARYGLINWKTDPELFCANTNYDFAGWIWWVLGKLPKRDLNEEPYLWQEIQGKLNVVKTIDQNIIQLYPRFLHLTILEQINRYWDDLNIISNEGFLFDVYKSLDKNPTLNNFIFLDRIAIKTKKVQKFITIADWINWTKKKQEEMEIPNDGPVIFDPRLSEWAALEIISWITKLVITKVQDVQIDTILSNLQYSKYIHPNNFLLSEELIQEKTTLSWENLRKLFDEEKNKLEFRPLNELIRDVRFSPEGDSESEIQSAINGIAALLICLLAKDYYLPPKWNPIGHQLAWLGLYKSKLKSTAISSFTRNILDGCFSNKNKESRIILTSLAEQPFLAEDTLNDPPMFIDLSQFLTYIQHSQSELRKQQLSVSEHQPRQLIPIKLRMLKRNSYQDYHSD